MTVSMTRWIVIGLGMAVGAGAVGACDPAPERAAGGAVDSGQAAQVAPDPCEWPLPASTATPSVSMLDCELSMPQLDRTRRVWIYLPPGYEASGERYPVLYMHDGQNVFDAATSYAGEWGVDEALDSASVVGDPGVIVVAVANGEVLRLDEYSPWVNPDLDEGGEGGAYVRFLVETLKPAIDSAYRTLPGREHTAIAGSSMGGLISLYAALERPDVFGLVGVFSPAFWFAPAVYDSVAAGSFRAPTRVYMVTGAREGDDPERYVRGHQRMAELLREAGGDGLTLAAHVRENGTHSEGFWRREFPSAYAWLFER